MTVLNSESSIGILLFGLINLLIINTLGKLQSLLEADGSIISNAMKFFIILS